MILPRQSRPVTRRVSIAKITASVQPSNVACVICHTGCNALPPLAQPICHALCDQKVC